ncbi:ribosomal protein S10 domain-containing protein, partial [Schizophyllum fasciatum]
PFLHPRPHRVPVASLQLAGHNPAALELFAHFATHAASALGIPVSRPARLPTRRSMWTVIKSPFVHKKSQENFERRTHKRVIKAWDADGEVVRRWAAYLRKHAMGGVGMRMVIWDR